MAVAVAMDVNRASGGHGLTAEGMTLWSSVRVACPWQRSGLAWVRAIQARPHMKNHALAHVEYAPIAIKLIVNTAKWHDDLTTGFVFT